MAQWWRRFRPSRAQLRQHDERSLHAKYQLLLAATPNATRAQRQQDAHPHGYRHRHERIRTLIAFNDLFVDTVLLVSPDGLPQFAEQLYRDMKHYCQTRREPCFSEEQFTAIMTGLSREIAVYNGAKTQGLAVRMTSRIEDGLGVDMQVSDPATRRYVNVDCKAPSAFRHRVYDLLREGRLSQQAADVGVERGYVEVRGGQRGDGFMVIILCIDPDVLGEIHAFAFVHTGELGTLLRRILQEYGLRDGGYGQPIGAQLDSVGRG